MRATGPLGFFPHSTQKPYVDTGVYGAFEKKKQGTSGH